MSEEVVSTPAPEINSEAPNEAASASEESGEGNPTPEPKSEPKARFRVKVDNQEIEVDQDELIKGYAHAKSANERFQKAAQERKALEVERARIAEEKAAAEAMKAAMKKDPWGTLASLGLSDADIRGLAEDKLLNFLEQEQMSPEQKKARELELKVKEYESKEAERLKKEEETKQEEMKRKEAEEFEQLKATYEKEYEDKLLQELEKSSLPKSPASIRRVADKIYQSMLAGEEIPVDHAVRLAEYEFRTSLAEVLKDLDEEALEAYLGEETLKKVSKRAVSKLKNPAPSQKVPVKDESKAKPAANSTYVNPKDFIEELKKKHGVKF